MNLYLTSLFVFAIPANIVAAIIIWYGRREQMKWSAIEYLLIYLPWLLAIELANFAFENLENAVRQLDVGQIFLTVLFAVGGILGGLSLIPRLFFTKHRQYALLITSVSSLIFATLFVKFVLLVFLVAG